MFTVINCIQFWQLAFCSERDLLFRKADTIKETFVSMHPSGELNIGFFKGVHFSHLA